MAPLHSGAHRTRARRGAALAAVLALLAAPRPALAHAIVLDSTPAAGSVVPGPDVALEVRFNCRIDGERSQLSLLSEDGRDREIERSQVVAKGTLSSRATGLAPGAYRLRWQVLAVDGHITRGDIAFRVAGP